MGGAMGDSVTGAGFEYGADATMAPLWGSGAAFGGLGQGHLQALGDACFSCGGCNGDSFGGSGGGSGGSGVGCDGGGCCGGVFEDNGGGLSDGARNFSLNTTGLSVPKAGVGGGMGGGLDGGMDSGMVGSLNSGGESCGLDSSTRSDMGGSLDRGWGGVGGSMDTGGMHGMGTGLLPPSAPLPPTAPTADQFVQSLIFGSDGETLSRRGGRQ